MGQPGVLVVQVLLFLTFVGTATWKWLTPRDQLGAMLPWVLEHPPWFLHVTAAADLAGGLGVLLPTLTGIRPRLLTVLASYGLMALMACAVAFHWSRGEFVQTPFNFVLMGMAFYVARVRSTKSAPKPASD
jgi:hypothetical protein